MSRRTVSAIVLAAACSAVLASAGSTATPRSGTLLSGVVSSVEEGPMEGVLVTAKADGSTIATTVVSDAKGRYAFPAGRLKPGQYTIRVRAIGYDLTGGSHTSVDAGKRAAFDIRLAKTADLAAQLSNGEWFMSWPGDERAKNSLLNCTQCHTLERVARSKHTATEWEAVIQRMSRYAQGSTPSRPQLRPGSSTGDALLQQSDTGREGDAPVAADLLKQTARYLASINLSEGPTWSYPLKTLPRPKGRATRVVITEYDLPRKEALPHDAVPDAAGMVWFSDFGSNMVGRLDPRTGAVTEYPVPATKPGAPTGELDLVVDRLNEVWLGGMFQGDLIHFDPKIEAFQTWGSPKFLERDKARIAMVMPLNRQVDGKVWIGGDDEYQVDIKSGEWKAIDYSVGLPKDIRLTNKLSSYGVASDSRNNFYGMNLNGTYIIRIDAKTLNVTPFQTPTPNSGPRRGHMDAQDRLWFGEFRGNRIGMFDTRTLKFREWAAPSPWTNIYDAVSDRAGYAWGGGMNNDRIVRVNSRTGEVVDYLLPRMTNVRRVSVDNRARVPVFWVGNNLGASLIKLEILP